MQKPIMPIKMIQSLIDSKSVAILLGNGYNNYINSTYGSKLNSLEKMPSWADLVFQTANKLYLSAQLEKLDKTMLDVGLSYPEAFSLLTNRDNSASLHQAVSEIIREVKINDYVAKVAETLREWDCPVITTNYDVRLENSINLTLKHYGTSQSKYYPIDYYSFESFFQHSADNPCNSFSIWHCNGFVLFPLSLRLNLYDYCNYIAWLKKRIPTKEGNGNSVNNEKSWLAPFFQKKLIIVGLGLSLSETHLRWLLLAKYNSRQERGGDDVMGYYLYAGKINEGLKLFLEGVGITPCVFNSWADIYSGLFRL